MKNNQKGFANVVLVGVLVILVGLVSYFSFSRKSNNLSVSSAPVITYVAGEKPFVQINFDYSVADNFNIYRSTNLDGNWQKINTAPFPSNAHTAVDYDFPKDATTLYYRIVSINKNGTEGSISEVASVYVIRPLLPAESVKKNETKILGMTVLSPISNQIVSFPIDVQIEVSGTGGWKTFEGEAGGAQLFDSSRKVLTDREVLTGSSSNFLYDFPQRFWASLGDSNTTKKITTKEGYILLWSAGAADNDVIKELKIPVRFSQ